MKFFVLLFALLCNPLLAGKLPTFGVSPWFKTYNGYEYRKYDVVLTTEGIVAIYPKIEKERVSDSYAMEIKALVQYREFGSKKWISRTVRSTGFEVKEPAAVQREKAEIIATVTGDVKYKLRVEHDKQGVNIFTEFVEKPDYSKAQYRLLLIADYPDLYNLGVGSKQSEISEKLRGDSITIEPVHDDDIQKKRYRLKEQIDPNAYLEAGIKMIELEAKRYGKNDIYLSLVDEDKGTIIYEPSNPMGGSHKGFSASTVIVNQTGETRSTGLRVLVK